MTTLPSGPEGTCEAGAGGYDRAQASYLQRQVAEGFGADAGRYDRARPAYPAGLVDRIIAASPGRDVLDVGCGTGISARLFAAAGCRVLGVDPDPRMAGLARQGGTETEPEEWLSYWQRPYTREEWLDLVPTTGGFTRHPEAVQAELLDGLGAAVDAAGGTFTMSYATIAATAARLAS